MPSGYTSDIYEGKNVSAQEFVLKCARAFGATVMMRDESLDKEIPLFEASTYHLDQIEKSKNDLEKYSQMSIKETEEILIESYNKQLEQNQISRKEYNELEDRYMKVLKEVEKWTPPTKDHVKLKEYALDQLKQSISHDCNQSFIRDPEKMEAREWLDFKIGRLKDDIAYHQKNWEQEVQRANERNQWVIALKESFK